MMLVHERSVPQSRHQLYRSAFTTNSSSPVQCGVNIADSVVFFLIAAASNRGILNLSQFTRAFPKNGNSYQKHRGCCAIATKANLTQAHNSFQWQSSSTTGSIAGAMVTPFATSLTSDLFCNKSFLRAKNGSRPHFRFRHISPIHSKMFVPGFGEASPEAKAAAALHNFFTYVAVKIVASQLEDYNKEAYEDLMAFLEKVPLKDGDKFIAALMRESFRHKNLALRIMEVRSAYAKQDFEWDNLQNLSAKQIEEANKALMRKFLIETSNME